ncbi:MAG: bifunctional riboflavin kinase/FAD synthetase [Clostridiales bacterium]|nr:bifunctional riboflavin kinase/FAD synthetase [bacterium 210917-SL.2.15]MCI5843690.1 bifunctional riboflavin kinase/FAD synthetase [Clostridiales bacterium]MDY4037439.1 bifunctional riboflavin kinase/FAD synthetase [Candidatus Pseudoscilispira sp.]
MEQTHSAHRAIALGFFDGIHRGHGQLMERAILRAREYNLRPAVFTFDRHPSDLYADTPVQLINSAQDRADLIHRLYGIREVIFSHFDEAMMRMPWEDFLTKMLYEQYGARYLVCGEDFHFGYRGEGNPSKLAATCKMLSIGCDIIPLMEIDGTKVGSTYIRSLLAEGDMERATKFLGHPHCLSHTVEHGKRLGSSIGIPTVNLTVPPHVLTPAHGVYATRVQIGKASYMGVTNVGIRPTVDHSTHVTVETFILDFNGDLYGQTLRVDFYKRLRDERKFASLDELKIQIQRDMDSTRSFFQKHP